MSNQIEQIRAEIKRLIKHNAEHPKDEITADVYEYALQDVLEILDTIEAEEKDHTVLADVQEAADKAAEKYGKEHTILPDEYNDGDIPVYEGWTADAFKAGIGWERARKMRRGDEDLEAAIDDFEDWDGSYSRADLPTSYTTRDIARIFANWQRERMMKEAVEGTLGYGPHLLRPIVMLEQVPKIWDGSSSNPVSVIIIKKEN